MQNLKGATQISLIRVSHYLSRGRLFFRSSLISTLPLESNCILKITFRPQIFISTITCSRNRTCNFISIYDDENKCFYWNIILYKLHLRNNIILSLILIRLSHTMFCQLSRFPFYLAYVLFCAHLINSILYPSSTYLYQKKHCHWKLLVFGPEYLQQQNKMMKQEATGLCMHRNEEYSFRRCAYWHDRGGISNIGSNWIKVNGLILCIYLFFILIQFFIFYLSFFIWNWIGFWMPIKIDLPTSDSNLKNSGTWNSWLIL